MDGSSPENQMKWQTPEEAAKEASESAVKGAAAVGEHASERVSAGGDPVLDETARQEMLGEMAKVTPGLDNEERVKLTEALSEIGGILADRPEEGFQKDAPQLPVLAEKYKALGLTQDNEKTEAFLKGQGFSDPEIQEIKKGLPASLADKGADKMSEQEAAEKGKVVDTLKEGMETRSKETKAAIEAKLKEINESEGTEEEKELKKAPLLKRMARVTALTKVKDFFADGEPGNEWARKAGKTLYWIVMIIIIAGIAELNMISKLTGK